MIRCIPVDGSEAFEIRDTSTLDRWDGPSHIVDYADVIATHAEARAFAWTPRHDGRDVACHLESWRERAERLEKELAELRRKIALDAMDKRREHEHP